jgi:hypothetical protein
MRDQQAKCILPAGVLTAEEVEYAIEHCACEECSRVRADRKVI